MLPAERRQKMARTIKQQGAVNTRDLAKALGISIMTVRRDLKILEEQNLLEITWGGAVPLGFQAHDIPRAHKASSMQLAKGAIAHAALDLIEEESFIALDAGTTTLELARLLPALGLSNLNIVTPDLEIALLLSGQPGMNIYMAGGQLDPVSRACNDAETVDYLRQLRTTIAFMGTNVWNVEHGVTTSSSSKMHLKRQIMESSQKCVLLADSSKYANYSPWRVAGVEEFDLVITDVVLSAEARKDLETAGAQLRYAGS